MIKENFTVVIPCKNEEKYIERTLRGIDSQMKIEGTRVIIADGESTDSTLQVIENLKKELSIEIEVIEGGTVSVGRNRGGSLVNTEFIVFVDADAVFLSRRTFLKAEFARKNYDLITCKLKCTSFDLFGSLIFSTFNIIQRNMKESFSTGVFMAVKKEIFEKRDFDETVHHSEDYLFSRDVPRDRFCILDEFVGQDNRRFKKTGYFRMIKLVIRNYFNRKNIDHFRKDINYW